MATLEGYRTPTEGAPGNTAELSGFQGQTLVLGFAARLQFAERGELATLRAELRGLGAALLLATPTELYGFRPDDEFELLLSGARLAEVAREAWFRKGLAANGGQADRLTLFVVDGSGNTRWSSSVSIAGDPLSALTAGLSMAGRSLLEPQPVALSRREILVSALVAAFMLTLVDACRKQPTPAAVQRVTGAAARRELPMTLKVNGEQHQLQLEPRVSLLDVLRERLALTGTKKGCDHGQCGACTVLLGDKRVNSCLLLAVMAQGVDITTVEGLGSGEALDPMQQAFIEHDGLQCGYCTPGQIMSAIGLVRENRAHARAEIREQMSGNLCRCGAYNNIVSAIEQAQKAARPT